MTPPPRDNESPTATTTRYPAWMIELYRRATSEARKRRQDQHAEQRRAEKRAGER